VEFLCVFSLRFLLRVRFSAEALKIFKSQVLSVAYAEMMQM
jgi:hypothetical protein